MEKNQEKKMRKNRRKIEKKIEGKFEEKMATKRRKPSGEKLRKTGKTYFIFTNFTKLVEI